MNTESKMLETETIGHSSEPVTNWEGLPGLGTAPGEHFHVAERHDHVGPLTVSFKFEFACPVGAAGVRLRSVRKPNNLH